MVSCMSWRGEPGVSGMVSSAKEFKTSHESVEDPAMLAEKIQESMRQELWPKWADESCIDEEQQTNFEEKQ